MVFLVTRRRITSKNPEHPGLLIHGISSGAIQLLIYGKEKALKGLQHHASTYEPLQYSYRLETPPIHDHKDLDQKDGHQDNTSASSGGAHPISAIVRSDIPRRFREYFLDDDIIFFRTRTSSYLTNVATAYSKTSEMEPGEQHFNATCEKTAELIIRRNRKVFNDSYHSARQLWWLALAIYVVFMFPAIWKESPRTLIVEPMTKQLDTAEISLISIFWTSVNFIRVFTSTSIQIFSIWRVFIFALPWSISLCALPLKVHARLFYEGDSYEYDMFRDLLRDIRGFHRQYPPLGPSSFQLLQEVRTRMRVRVEELGDPDVAAENERVFCCIDNQIDPTMTRPHHSTLLGIWRTWKWLLIATWGMAIWWEWGGLRPCFDALRSFWAFHRQTTRSGDKFWYRARNETEDSDRGVSRVRKASRGELVVERANILQKGDLVVCLKPYPDLVTMTGLGWLNQLYLSYRNWQRWLLAERVYHDLERETANQAPLKNIMFHSVAKLEAGLGARFRSRSGGAGDDELADGQEYLVAEIAVAENDKQRGDWLR